MIVEEDLVVNSVVVNPPCDQAEAAVEPDATRVAQVVRQVGAGPPEIAGEVVDLSQGLIGRVCERSGKAVVTKIPDRREYT